jgi:hypothetical protein
MNVPLRNFEQEVDRMKQWFFTAIAIGLMAAGGFFADPPVQALSPASLSPPVRARSAAQATTPEEKREPTFEETKEFILKYTRGESQDSEGNIHKYSLSISDRKLRLTRRFTSKFMPGFVEKIEVPLSDLDPTRVETEEEGMVPYLALATSDGERKISVEVTMTGPSDGPQTRKVLARRMGVPGADGGRNEAQDRLNERLKKAWAHLIKLAGGRPSKEEPF